MGCRPSSLVLASVCLILRIAGPVEKGALALIYNGFMIILGPLAGITGYNGGADDLPDWQINRPSLHDIVPLPWNVIRKET